MQKIKKVLGNAKNTCFSLSNFRFFSLQKRGAGAPDAPQALRNGTAVENVEQNMHKTLIFQEKKYLQKIKIVLAKNKKSTCK